MGLNYVLEGFNLQQILHDSKLSVPLSLSIMFVNREVLGSVVRRLISANPRLNFNLDFFIPLFKCLVGIVFRVLYRASNNHIIDKKNSTEFSSKTVRSEIRFHTNPQGYLNLALNNPALDSLAMEEVIGKDKGLQLACYEFIDVQQLL